MQVKLLRALQERQFERVGGRRTITVDVRIVTATNRDLEEAVRQGGFRLDLYHRLSVVALTIPPLRERADEIAALAEHFLRLLSAENGRAVTLAPDAVEALVRSRWPGNVRQLRNCLERALVTTTGARIAAGDLALDAEDALAGAIAAPEAGAVNGAAPPPDGEAERIRAALERCGFVKAKAARVLGMTVRQLAYRVRKYGIAVERF